MTPRAARLFLFTYAEQDARHQNDVPGAGLGFIDVFNAKVHFCDDSLPVARWTLRGA